MIYKTIIGISQALKEEFKENCVVFNEEEQELKSSCFLIVPTKYEQKQKLGNRYELLQSFEIRYIPLNAKEYTLECANVMPKLFATLEYITIDGDLTRGTNMSAQIQDGMLHFFVDFNLFVLKVEERFNMETMQSGVLLKEGE
ncbi:phage tail terminator family protein [Candidatus Galacturonibacter soehngenii]|uniref:Uncharacterized protein n=1 Tax=Candidatus Galacturonatibacter soehngenii TaxID=2307010 RepID=A0A7V7QIR4_9FIRM|nr:hypothetical protein [Candidatus Galacturonibacter soehngenii]KAB1436593.1 hypothetical protein F7O84_14635 [Candidatus Galacturonibacter soehngenii]